MKLLVFFLTAALVLALTGMALGAEKVKPGKGKLRHLVALKFKSSASAEDVHKIEQAFRALKTKIPQIASFEWGTNISPENRNKGFTHAFLVTFQNDKDRDTYLNAGAHQDFVKLLGPVLDDVFVIDFKAQK